MSTAPPIHLPAEGISGPSREECDYVLGTYIRLWGDVEGGMAELIRKLLDTDMTTSQIVIRALADMRVQREMAEELGKHRLTKNSLTFLTRILDRVKSMATKRNRMVHGKWILRLKMGKRPNPQPLTAESAKWVRIYHPSNQDDIAGLMSGRSQKLKAAYEFSPERIAQEAEAAKELAKDLNDFANSLTLKPPRIPLPVEW